MRRSPISIVLTNESRGELERLVRSTKTRHGLARRAQIVLHFVDGEPIARIARRLDLQRHTVRHWLRAFEKRGCVGLDDAPRSGRPPVFSPRGRDPRRQDRVRVA